MSTTPPPDRRVNVLVACDHIGFEGNLHGSGRVMVEMASARWGDGVRLFPCVLQSGGGLEEQCRRDGVPLRFMGFGRFDPRQVWALLRMIRRHDIHVLHVWDFGAATYGRVAGLLTGRPVVVHVQSQHSRHQRRGFPSYVRLAYKLLAPRTARAVALAPSIRDFAVAEMGFAPEQVVLVPNPSPHSVAVDVPAERVDMLRRRYGLTGQEPVIGTLTRFFEAKGIAFLVEAMPAVLEAHPTARLLLVGEGPLRGSLERQARELGVAEQVTFAGFQSDVAAHLRLFTVMAMPSLEEGMPLAALEAIAAGVPVVATPVGGLGDIVVEGRTGVLVRPADAPDLARGLIRVLEDADLLEELRRGCLEERHRFSFDHFQDRLTELYREVAA